MLFKSWAKLQPFCRHIFCKPEMFVLCYHLLISISYVFLKVQLKNNLGPCDMLCRIKYQFTDISHNALMIFQNSLPYRSTVKSLTFRHIFAAFSGFAISSLSQIVDLLAPVTLKFEGWRQKIIGYFFYTTSSFVHHFIAIWVTVQKRSNQVKIADYVVLVTSKFDGKPRKQ